MSALLRTQVLQCFRQLHRTRRKVFQEDLRALEAARQQINSEFRKHAWVSNAATITELLKFGNQVEHILRTTVIQLTPKDSETYVLDYYGNKNKEARYGSTPD